MMKITIHRTQYVPTEDGDRDDVREWSTALEFDSAREIAEYLVKQGIDQPSSGPDYHHTIWWSDEPYEHPEGYVVERSAHHDEPTVPDAVWREVWLRMTSTPAQVLTHLVERTVANVKPGDPYGNRANPDDLPRMAQDVIRALAGELDDYDDLGELLREHFAEGY